LDNNPFEVRENQEKTKIVLQSKSSQVTWELGRQVGERVTGGEIICLAGPIGAGKTVFVAGLAAGLNVASTITSPTFVIMSCYEGRLPLCHVDLYRMDAPIETIGLEEYLTWNGVTAIEWAEKGKFDFSLFVECAYAGEDQRTLTLTASPGHVRLIDGLA
jgi:tRNA threonylcarbamoyladenosine biosynthesis protein TsaE